MITIETYRGHIRNWRALGAELGLWQEMRLADGSYPILDREKREKDILVKGYAVWGKALPDHLHGMFAFALYDDEKEELFCARDPFGTKLFYYAKTDDGRLIFGTMIRDILADPGYEKKLNEKMLQIYLTLTYGAGEETFFDGLLKLMPGHTLTLKGTGVSEHALNRLDGDLQIERYFAPSYAPDETKSKEAWADEIHETLLAIMKEVKEADETCHSFLSGGVDSSYVLAVSDAVAGDSCGYDDERFDESHIAAETAKILGREHNIAKVTPEQFFAEVPFVMENMEQPLADASAIVFTLGCKATAAMTKICYSGEGADEFFGGYNMYRNASRYGDNLPNFYVGNTNIMKEEEKERLLRHYDPSILPIDLVKDIYQENEGLDPLTRMADVDIRIWLEGDIYLNVDKMSTAAGLEIRMPLTDRRIFDIASRMPANMKVDETQNKVAFRTAAAKVLPEEIAFRKKLGFIVPIRIWMADARYNQDMVKRFHSEAAAKFFKVEEIDAIWNEYLGGNSDLWRKLWTIYTFLVWYDIYFGDEAA